ncbi:MAG: hypothetical protein JXA68_05260 [Ignavibacteriales bacterium]|nr:hypothetical protein [Ignavibacteriales bacterium]
MKNKLNILICLILFGVLFLLSGCYTKFNLYNDDEEYYDSYGPYYPPCPPEPYYPPYVGQYDDNSGSTNTNYQETHSTHYRDNTGERNPSNENTTTRNDSEQSNKEDNNSTTRNSGERNPSRR